MLVLDWGFEANIDFTIMEANMDYVACSLGETLTSLYLVGRKERGDAASFISALRSGVLPSKDVGQTCRPST